MDFWCANRVNSASFCDKSGRFVARFLNGLMSYFRRSQLHNPNFSSKILEFTLLGKCGNALDSVDSQNLIKKLNKKILIKVFASFCFRKKKSPLYSLDSNPPNKADSAKDTN